MVELAMPGGPALLMMPLPTNTLVSHSRLQHGVLLWVLAGHLAAIWLVRADLEMQPQFTEPQVLRAHWINPASMQAAPTLSPAAPPAAVQRQNVALMPTRAPTHAPVAAPAPLAPTPALASEIAISTLPAGVSHDRPEPVLPATASIALAQPVVAVASPAAAATASPSEPPSLPTTPPASPPSFHADYLANPTPEYPALSRRLREEGTVRLRVHVDANGLPLEIGIAGGSGYPRLDQAARAAVAGWRFVPARLGERAVAGWVVVPINFSLRR